MDSPEERRTTRRLRIARRLEEILIQELGLGDILRLPKTSSPDPDGLPNCGKEGSNATPELAASPQRGLTGPLLPGSRIPNPVNDKQIDALCSVSSRIRDIRWEMERLTGDSLETDDPELPPTFKSPDAAIPPTRKELRRFGMPTNESGPRDGPVSRFQGEITKRTGTQLIR